MPPVQTAVAAAPAIGVPGQEYDAGFSDVVTKIASEAIPFGAFVAFVAAGACELPDSSGEVTTAGGCGVALLDQTKASQGGYEAGDAVRVLVRGRAFVLNEEAITHGDAVYVRHTAAGAEQQGAFRNDADTTDATIPPGMRWFQGGAIGQAVIEVGYGGSAGSTGATGATGATGPTGPTG
jgi:hypothetical protein